MKFIIKICLAVTILLSFENQKIHTQPNEVNFQFFFDNLSPYGFWSLHPDFGYVWIPDAEPGFVPYLTEGYWVFTNFGWTWVSNYEWGWAPFHYGRWDWDELYGWFWVPGNEWGPAWVVWRRANGYYGWAPLSPGVSLNISFGIYRDRPERWIFVRDRDFVRHDFYNYHINRRENINIINNSTVVNNTYIDNRRNTTYITGPTPEEVQRVSGRRINTVRVQDNSRPGTNLYGDQLQIYRPSIRRTNMKNQKPAPSKVIDIQEVRRRRNLPTSGNSNPSERTHPNSTRSSHENPEMNAPMREQNSPVRQNNPINRRRDEAPQQSIPENQSPPQNQPVETSPRREQQATPPPSREEYHQPEKRQTVPSQHKEEPQQERRRSNTSPTQNQTPQQKPENQSAPNDNNRRQSQQQTTPAIPKSSPSDNPQEGGRRR